MEERAAIMKYRDALPVICAKMAEPIEIPFGIWTRVDPRKHTLGRAAHWRHLANTIEPSMCGGDAACCQITLSTCCVVLHLWNNHICSQKFTR